MVSATLLLILLAISRVLIIEIVLIVSASLMMAGATLIIIVHMFLKMLHATIALIAADSSFGADLCIILHPIFNLYQVIPLQLLVRLICGGQARRGNVVLLLVHTTATVFVVRGRHIGQPVFGLLVGKGQTVLGADTVVGREGIDDFIHFKNLISQRVEGNLVDVADVVLQCFYFGVPVS